MRRNIGLLCLLVLQPSFGYVITSPEKREPFALIHPTELSAGTDSPLNDTEVGPADKTLNPGELPFLQVCFVSGFCFSSYILLLSEDLDKTLEEAGGGIEPDPKQPEVIEPFAIVLVL